jgi:hypothetical protein
MAQRKWVFDLEGKQHEILLKHGPISGREIWLDGQLIEKGRVRPDIGSEHFFSIDGCSAELGIVTGTFRFEYYLRINGQFVFSKDDTHRRIGKFTTKKLEDRQKWIELANKHGLNYLPLPLKPFIFRNRLIGYMDNFLLLIVPTMKSFGENSTPGFVMGIRHSPIEQERAKEIKNDEEIKQFFKRTKTAPDWLEINQEITALFVAPGLKKVNDFELVERLISFFHIISKKLKPTQAGKCEGIECKSPYYKDLMLTLLNGVPLAMCQDCIDDIDRIGKRTEEEYKKRPSNLLKGTIYGSAAAVLSALICALVFIFLDQIGTILALLIFFPVIKAMDYAKTKRTFISLLIASLLSMIGSIAGTFLGIAGYLFREGKFDPSLSEFIRLAKLIMDDPKTTNQLIVAFLLILVPFLFTTWSNTRSGLKSYFKPEVEIIRNFELKQ